MSGNMKDFVPVPPECMGHVIGSKGKYINKIKQETHTEIQSRNADHLGRESGFTVIGSEDNIEAAREAIQRRVETATVMISELVPQQFVGLLIRRGGSDNFRRIEEECDVKIFWPKFSGKEKNVIFDIRGSRVNCERAQEMLRTSIEEWKKNEVYREVACGSKTNSKDSLELTVPKEYLKFILGSKRQNLDRVETKSGTKIIVLSRKDVEAETAEDETEEVTLKIIGQQQNCIRAKSLIRSRIISVKDYMMREELGGNKHFVCLDFNDENSEFQLEQSGNAPKLDGYLKGPRYRIVTEKEDDYTDESEVSDNTISELKDHLLISLEKLHNLKDERELSIDLWCHFGKVFFHNVDEDEVKGIFTPEDICERVQKIVSPSKKRAEKQAYWKVSFEEGVDPLDDGDRAFPEVGDNDQFEFDLKLVHTQWRYDFAFTTASERYVRLKAWEGLPPGRNEPPVEVKNILRQVFLRGNESIKAWICYAATSVLRGEIMTPSSQYDCRMKLRAGSRYVIDKDSACEEEDKILCDYLSNCKFDEVNHRMHLPDEKIPEGFECTFYRGSKERMFSATVDGQYFTVILLDEKGWDSDSSTKRDQKQFGIRVVMDSWSEALLYHERPWKPDEILDKLKDYMAFLSLLKNYLFEG